MTDALLACQYQCQGDFAAGRLPVSAAVGQSCGRYRKEVKQGNS